MKRIIYGLATVSTFTATSASAETATNNWYIDGYVEVSSAHSSGLNETLGAGSIDFGRAPRRGNGVGVGFSFGLDAVKNDLTGTSQIAIYPAVTFALGETGLLSVGAPRSVMDAGYLPKDTFAYASELDSIYRFSGFVPSVTSMLHLYGPDLFATNVYLYGLRYDGEFNQTKIGASYHRILGLGADVDAYSVAFSQGLGPIGNLSKSKLFGGAEILESPTGNSKNFSLGYEASSEQLRLGLMLSSVDSIFGIKSATLYSDYKITENFTIAGTVTHFDVNVGLNSEVYSLGAEYHLNNGAYANVSFSDAKGFSTNGLVEASIGWRF